MFTYDSLPKTENGASEPRLIIVSNRLPVTITKEANGDYTFKVYHCNYHAYGFTDVIWRSCVSAVRLQKDHVIHMDRMARQRCTFEALGKTDMKIPVQDREYLNRRLLEEYQCYPVYLSDDLADRHYNG